MTIRAAARATLAALLLTALVACGGSDDGDAADESGAPTSAAGDEVTGTDDGASDAPDLGRVIVLGEEVLLADVLELGLRPIAASASVPTVGFQGIDEADVEGIEVLPMTELDLEEVVALRADTVITYQFWVDQVPSDQAAGLGDDLIVLPDGMSPEEQVEALGRELGRETEADDLLARLADAREAAKEQVGDDCSLSLATVYAGPSLVAWTDGPWAQPSAIMDLGCELVPNAEAAPPESNGRAYLSDEQVELFAGPKLVLLQNDTVDGESEALAAVEANPLWASLPAVQDDEVVVLDRLGYPGAPGLIRFLADVGEALAP